MKETGSAKVQVVSELTDSNLSMLDALVVQSGWNQVAQDWALFHSLGTIFAIHDAQERIVASGAVLPMGESTARPDQILSPVTWISMILVTPAARGNGLGRTVFEQCVRHVLSQGRVPMLDATPQGEPLYRQFGFQGLWPLTRWRREARPATRAALPPSTPALDALVANDAQALGFHRPDLLRRIAERPDSRNLQRGDGFAVVRAGRTAHHLGPLLATHEASAIALLTDVADSLAGPLLIDAVDEKALLRQALLDAGFAPQRGFTRMALLTGGQHLPRGNKALLHAIAGPEYG